MTGAGPIPAAGPTDAAGPRLSIGRLTLDVPWMSEQDARRLAVLVAEALRQGADALRYGPDGPPRTAGRLDRLDVAVPPQQPPAGGTDLAGPIARAVLDSVLKELA